MAVMRNTVYSALSLEVLNGGDRKVTTCMFLYIYSLFNDAACNIDYIA
jgi:hypothetical protein